MIYSEFSAVIIGVFGLVITWLVYRMVCKQNGGDGVAREIAEAIHSGAMVFIRQEYAILFVFVLLLTFILSVFIDIYTALAFVVGAGCSGLAGFIGMHTATRANVRTAFAAKEKTAADALSVAFFGGSVMGMTIASIGLIGLGLLFYFYKHDPQTLFALNGFGMGASVVALFARVGGGIYTKSADVGADLVGKVEKGIPEDDPRNPGVIADNVGDNVGDVAGMGADIFESYCSSIIATIAIAATLTTLASDEIRQTLMMLPLTLSATGLVSSVLGIGLVRVFSDRAPAVALRIGVLSAVIIFVTLAWIVVNQLNLDVAYWYTLLVGALGSVIIGSVTDYYTEQTPVRRIAKAGQTGPATVIISGIAVGMQSVAVPVIALGGVIILATNLTGLYGVALAAVGMLATVGIIMAIDAYGPIADNAGGIAEMAGMGERTRAITDQLDQLGNTTAAVGKGFAIGAAALAALAVISAFVANVSIHTENFSLSLDQPLVLVGLFLGGMLPFLFSSMTMTAVGDAAGEMIVEIRRQFHEITGLMEGTAKPDYERCTAIATNAALKRMVIPGLLAITSPIVVGFSLGPEAVGGLLAGSLLAGMLLAITLSNAGAVWDNAKKYIEKGNLGGKFSDAHNAAVVGDTVGDPFKDTSGPALNILIKVLAMISLIIAPFL
ncbi:MAG: sodium-translocating pyrophosphatase [Pseudomonadales bacterium]|nr:sodium-translocating pyrophosphatase [Pseudomonadales bacterium]